MSATTERSESIGQMTFSGWKVPEEIAADAPLDSALEDWLRRLAIHFANCDDREMERELEAFGESFEGRATVVRELIESLKFWLQECEFRHAMAKTAMARMLIMATRLADAEEERRQ